MKEKDEEELLRAVTLQTAQAVFLARQRAEEELARSRDELRRQSEWLRVTMASIGDAVVTTDTNGNVLTLNAVAEKLTGWTQGEAEGRPLSEIFVILNEESRVPVENPAERALKEGRVVGLANHTILVARDGTETPIDDSAAPIRDDDGNVHGVVLVFRSIVERRQSERAVRENERELADFFENASVGMHWVGPDGVILRVNRAELDLLGYSREEYVGRHIAEFHADQDIISDILGRLTRGETLRDVEAAMRCKDGSVKYVQIDSSVLFEDGRFVHTRCFTRDMTDRRSAEVAQARLAAIVESSQDAIIGKTLDGRVLSWNVGAEHLFGYTGEEAVGQSIIHLVIPPDRQDEEVLILERLARGERIESYETVRVDKQRRRLHVSLTISPIRGSGGRIIAISKIARDVTARRLAERRLTTQSRVAETLAQSDSLQHAAPRLLQEICEHLEWDVGAFWVVKEGHAMTCVDVYHVPSVAVPRFEAASHELSFPLGKDLPGRVWQAAIPVWISDVTKDEEFSRAGAADVDGLHAGLALPILVDEEVVGTMEFFSRETRQRDGLLLESMTSLASQIGQFMERKRAEAALRESENRFRTLADQAPVMIWLNNLTGWEFANKSYLDFIGLTSEDVGGMKWAEYVHPDDLDAYWSAYLAAFERRLLFEGEMRFRRVDGVYRNVKSIGVPRLSPGGELLGYLGSTYDITDIKRAEQTTRFLAAAGAALADLTDYENTLKKVASLAVPHFADWCAVDILEPDGSLRRLAVAHVDPAKVKLVQDLEREFPLRTQASAAWRVSRTGKSEWAPALPEASLAAIGTNEHQLRIIRELGPKSFICVPLRSRTEALGALTFVTAESGRAYDASDLSAAEDLAHRAVIAIENVLLLAKLKTADRHKDEFLAMLAHELRNPLAPIRNAVHILRVIGPAAPELHKAADMIERQVLQMTRLVDDLLDVSRITRGKIELRKEMVDLATIVSHAVEASRPLIEKWGHQLTVSIPPEPIRLDADPTRLAQVLSNLVNNAAKYTNQGGRIQLIAERDADQVVLRVVDNGIGIPAAMRQHIFDLFTQVDSSLERSEGGLGIGLTLVQRLVEMHGGTVECISAGPGSGSEFVVRLPVMDSVKGDGWQATGSGRRVTTTTVPRRILVVDNNHDAADSLGMLLRMMGNLVHTTYDGLTAMAAADSFLPDVVLLDIGLPDLNGYEVARRIRKNKGGDRTILIAMTGWGQEEDRRRSREAGFNEHLTKPVEFAALQKILAEPISEPTER